MINRHIRNWLCEITTCVNLLPGMLLSQDTRFGERIDLGAIECNEITEASGIAASRKNPGILWTHNDSGGKNCLYAFDTKGKHLGIYTIAGSQARDWEDIAIGPGPVEGQAYLYIADIGDNAAKFNLKYIYRIPEPEVDANQSPVTVTLSGAEVMRWQYPDGNHDAETLLVDPLTKDIYIVSKSDSGAGVYRASYHPSSTRTITVDQVATLPFGWIVSGDISPSGDEILIKTYSAIYYWRRSPNQNLWQAFEKAPIKLPYILEPQGEAVCWKADGSGYYTISEEFQRIPAHLYFYPRLSPASPPRELR